MTERWRKKLEGIDRVGPSDDIYERAKHGPTMPEPQSPMQRTSTRVVTAIAAFVVFALGISVFAIPALRLGGEPRSMTAGDQIQPLWPWSSTEAVQAWSDDPQPIGTTSVDRFSLAPDVAAAFGRDVLGWSEVWANEEGQPMPPECAVAIAYTDATPTPPLSGACSISSNTRSLAPTVAAPTTVTLGSRTFDLSTCPPNASCPYQSPAPPSVKVVLYQPLDGDGPWAVLEAKSDYIGMSLDPGTALRDGSTVYASGLILGGAQAVLGFTTASSGCEGTGAVTGFEAVGDASKTDLAGQVTTGTYARGQIVIGLHPLEGVCARQPGYVYVALTEGDIGTGDPVGGFPPGSNVLAFVAVPVSFLFPSLQDSGAPPTPPVPPSPTGSRAVQTYTDPLGWTIDVPTTWKTQQERNQRVRFLGDGLAVEISPLGVSDADDSSFPLDPSTFLTQGEGGLVGGVRGDGSAYAFVVFKEDGGYISLDELSGAQASILDHMIASITFPASILGEGQNGWTAIAPVLRSASAEWVLDKLTGDHYLASVTHKATRVLFGPAPTCAGGGGSYEVRETGAAGIVCRDGTGGDWDLMTGQPQPGSSAGFDTALEAHDAVRSWDGWLLARLGPSA